MKYSIMKYYLICFLAVVTNVSVQADDQPITPVEVKLDREVNYAQDIAPILKKNCIACHNSKTREGELSLESPDKMLEGGDSGPSIAPGKPKDSFLYLVASHIEEPVMPPLPNKMNAHDLTGKELWKLKRWIELGAKGKALSGRSALNWTGPAANLHPIYSLTLTPNEDYVVSGIGNRAEMISLTDVNNRQDFIDPELKTFAHRDFVNAIAVDPTGRFAASAGYRIVKIWERSDPQTLHSLPAGSPIVIASRSGNGQFYCLVNQAGKVIVGAEKPGVTWESGIKQISAATVDDQGKLAFLATGNEIRVVDLASKNVVRFAVPSPAHSLVEWGGKIIAGHADGVIRFWHRPAGSATYLAQGTELKKHKTAVSKLELVAGELQGLISFSAEGLISLWDLKTNGLKNEWATGGDVKSFALSGDRKRLVSVHASGKVAVWNEQKKLEREIKSPARLLLQVKSSEENVAIAKSLTTYHQTLQKAAVKNVTDRKAALEKAKKALEETAKTFEASKKPKGDAAVALGAVKKEIAAAKETPELKKKLEAAQKVFDEKQKAFTDSQEKHQRANKTIGLETASLTKAEAEKLESDKHVEQAVAHSKTKETELAAFKAEVAKNTLKAVGVRFVDAQRLQVVTEQGLAEDWNLSNGLPLQTQSVGAVKQTVQILPLAQDHVCCIAADGEAHLVNMSVSWKLRSRLGPADGKLVVTDSQLVGRVTSLSFSPDGKLLATGGGNPSRDGELILWDWKAGEISRKISDAHSDVVLSVKFSRDGEQLLTGAADKFVKIFRVDSGEMVRSFEGHTEHVLSADWAADALSIASASADKTIKIWDTQNGSQKRTISGFGKQVTDLDYIGVGDKLVSSCGDKAVRMYTTSNGSNYRSLSGAENYLYSIAVTQNEELVISGGQGGIIRIWDAKTGKLLNSLKPVK